MPRMRVCRIDVSRRAGDVADLVVTPDDAVLYTRHTMVPLCELVQGQQTV